MPARLFLADLNHAAPQDRTFPYAVGCVASRALHHFGADIELGIFKSPQKLSDAFLDRPADLVGFSNYIWNRNLSYELAVRMKHARPATITVMGGPNYPEDAESQRRFLARHPDLDFCVFHEGEYAFEALLAALFEHDFDLQRLRRAAPPIPGCHYLVEGRLVGAPAPPKIQDLDSAFPSPYLSGLMDAFFAESFSPLVQYTRGCPFRCTFCVEGLTYYSQLSRQSARRFTDEIEYIACRVQGDPKLHIADANFGMYKEDEAVCAAIAEIQRRHGWPNRIHASTGKNETERIVRVVDLLGGALRFGAAIQSSDQGVLKNIKRSNISTERLMAAAQQVTTSHMRSYSDLILNLPGDTPAAHQDSLRVVMDAGIMRPVMNQLLLLPGTEMDTPAERERHGLVTRYRILPRSLGVYGFGEQRFSIGEVVETVVASSTMTFDEYLGCKAFDLSVELFYTDNYLIELTGWIRHLGLSPFALIRKCHEIAPTFSDDLRELYEGFRRAVTADLWESEAEIEAFVRDPERLMRYAETEYRNSLATNRAIAVFRQGASLHDVAREAARRLLREAGIHGQGVDDYIDEALRFSWARKGQLLDTSACPVESFTFDFRALAERNFEADPQSHVLPSPAKLQFKPTEPQVRLIHQILGESSDPLMGMRALLYRTEVSSLVDFFRDFAPVLPA